MVRFKTVRLSSIIYILIVVLLLIAIVFLAWRLLSGNPIGYLQEPLEERVSEEVQSGNPAYKSMLAGGFSAVAASDSGNVSLFSTIWSMLTREDLRDLKSIINYPMPYLEYAPELPDNEVGEAVEVVSNLPNRGPIDRSTDPIDISQLDSEEGDPQEISDEIRIQIKGIQVDDNPLEMTGEGPKIMIYHSHSRESYRQNPKDPYKEASSEPFRTDDHNYSVMKAGMTLSQQLTNKGIAVLHDKTNHEKEGYNASYSKSLKTLNKRMEEQDSLQMFIDVHRNAYSKKSSMKADNEVIVINGERVAKMMFVVGTGEGIVGGFNQKPNWKENAKLAIKITNKLNELYPGLAKPVYYRPGRFNQHVSTQSLLIELGSTLTTLDEVERATVYLAEAISQIVE